MYAHTLAHIYTHKLLGSLVSLQELPSSQWRAAEKGITSLSSFFLALCLMWHLAGVYWRFSSIIIIFPFAHTAVTRTPLHTSVTHTRTCQLCQSSGDQRGYSKIGLYSEVVLICRHAGSLRGQMKVHVHWALCTASDDVIHISHTLFIQADPYVYSMSENESL